MWRRGRSFSRVDEDPLFAHVYGTQRHPRYLGCPPGGCSNALRVFIHLYFVRISRSACLCNGVVIAFITPILEYLDCSVKFIQYAVALNVHEASGQLTTRLPQCGYY